MAWSKQTEEFAFSSAIFSIFWDTLGFLSEAIPQIRVSYTLVEAENHVKEDQLKANR